MRMWSPLHTLKESSREREMEGEGGQSYLKHSYYLVLYPHDARCILYDIIFGHQARLMLSIRVTTSGALFA